jgi:hypothetical protein
MGQRVPLMYGELADWFPLITAGCVPAVVEKKDGACFR